eukprot:m.135828 g.135828  ORF g.135828 m.135828 type:complete len:250 (+) comp10226_c0_seq1:75-824(+)
MKLSTIHFHLKFFLGMTVYFLTLLLIVVPANLVQKVFLQAKGFCKPAFQLFAILTLPVLGLDVVLKGNKEWFEEGHPPCVYVSNHQSQLDTVIYSRHIPSRTVVIAKKSLIFMPIVNLVMWVSDTIFLDRNNLRSSVNKLGHAAKEIKDKKLSVIIFPEGTRNRGGGILPFKKGAFHMAHQANVPIVPVVIQNYTSQIYNSETKVFGSGKIDVTILDPVDMSTFDTVAEGAEYVHDIMLKNLTEAKSMS